MAASPQTVASGSRRWLLRLATVLGVALTASLGLWQLDRAEQKKSMQRAIDARAVAAPLTAAQLPGPDETLPEALLHRRAALAGRWAPQHAIYLENRPMDGRVGFFVLTPLVLRDRPQEAVLVQRGWAPRHAADRTALPPVHTPAGEVQITGRLVAEASRVYALGQASETGVIRQNVDLSALRTALRQQAGLQLLPLVLLEQDGTAVVSSTMGGLAALGADGLRRDWPPPAVDLHKHYGYAFQWFALAALILGLYVWFQLLVPHRRRARDAAAA